MPDVPVWGYPTAGKGKARVICQAFVDGAGGRLAPANDKLLPGSAAFYGITPDLVDVWQQVLDVGRPWYYIDNAYFDRCRAHHFRVARNGLQPNTLPAPDFARLKAAGVTVRPWRRAGRHVLVVCQSDWYMRGVAGWPGGGEAWLNAVLARLKALTDRPVQVRPWSDKFRPDFLFSDQLRGAHAVVAHTSAAAVEALLAGVPAFLTGPCVASPMADHDLGNIEDPRLPDGRDEWAACLAAGQWTLDEMRAGHAWRAMAETWG